MDQPYREFSNQETAFDWAVENDGVLFVRNKYRDKIPLEKWTTVEKLRKCLVVIPATPVVGP
jgi:hypothetical protein